MPQSIFSISAAEKESNITKVAHLISKYYDDGSFVNEPGIVAKISKLLKPNQWLRVEDARYGTYDYSKPIDYKQPKLNMKPTGIWASKGEWSFGEGSNKELTLLEVDYSRILVLTTKSDYLEFEDKYCKKLPKKISIVRRKTRLSHRWGGGAKTITNKNTSSKRDDMVCTMYVNWIAVSKDYDGIAMVPFGKPYFNRKEMVDFDNHLWVATYDVSSLVIWKHDGKTPITRTVSLGTTGKLYKPGSSELDAKKVVQVLKPGIKELEKEKNLSRRKSK